MQTSKHNEPLFLYNFLRNHLVIILIFVAITLILLPEFLDNEIFPAFGKDAFGRVWYMWWYQYAMFDLGKDPFSATQVGEFFYKFNYPGDTPINSLLATPLFLIFESATSVYKVILF